MAGFSSNDAWGKVLSIISGLALSRGTDGTPETGEDVWYWREQVFFAVFLAGAVLGSLTYFPTLLKSIEKQHWDVALLYTVGYLGTLCVTFVWRIPYKVRAVLGLLFIYFIAIYTLNIVGLYGSGARLVVAVFPDERLVSGHAFRLFGLGDQCVDHGYLSHAAARQGRRMDGPLPGDKPRVHVGYRHLDFYRLERLVPDFNRPIDERPGGGSGALQKASHGSGKRQCGPPAGNRRAHSCGKGPGD